MKYFSDINLINYKCMLKSIRVISFLLFFVVKYNSFAQDSKMFNVAYDDYGRIVKDKEGNKINYSKSDLSINKKILKNENLSNISTATQLSNCGSSWKYHIMGDYIGSNSMKTMDFNNDGTKETYLSARKSESFWYELKYDAASNSYYQSWTSDIYFDAINYMAYQDLNNNGIYEIYVVLSTGYILVYDADSKILVNTINTGVNNINDLEFGDLNADGIIEMVYANSSNLYIANTTNFNLICQTIYGTSDFQIGNLDLDASNEIVTASGYVLQFNGNGVTNQWSYHSNNNYSGLVELSDIDLDGKKEIILALGWDTIKVYDADIQQLKFNYLVDLDIDALLVQDINNDNIDEIIYGDGQWGEIHCINATTRTQIWQVSNPEHGVTRISIADFDNDGTDEVMWGAGASSSGEDILYVKNFGTNVTEWKSTAIDGPYEAIDVADIDGDGALEIIAISNESESGYGSGILSIFDANTKALEWQSDGNFFYLVWQGIHDLKIDDIDNDGDMEIVVAAGQTYTGKIWIIDGTTKAIQSSHLFQTEDLDEFYALDIADVDNDGQKEIIVAGSKVCIINPSNFQIEWSSPQVESFRGNLTVSNIDSDSNPEIIVCGSYSNIFVFDAITHQMSQTSAYNYSSFDVSDRNNDGVNDIVAGKQNGEIEIINGSNLQVISSFQASTKNIEGILIQSIDSDTIPEVIFGSDGRLNFINSQGNISSTQQFGSFVGTDNAIKIIDINNDNTKEIFFGSSMAVLQLSASCTQCISFSNIINKADVSCGSTNNGSISVAAIGGLHPISYSWSNGSTDSTLSNVVAGTYYLTTNDNLGCSLSDTIVILQSQMDLDLFSSNVNCNSSILGSASININAGTPPFNYVWSNGGSTQTINNLQVGSYSVLVTDDANCASSFQFNINKDSISAYPSVNNANCGNNGSVTLMIYNTSGGTTINWSNGSQSAYNYGLAAGFYTYTVSNHLGCTFSDTVQVLNSGSAITINVSTTDDNPQTANGDGTASISATGGFPPYYIQWNDPFLQTSPYVNNLYAGTYLLTIMDSQGCSSQATVVIGLVNGIASIEQNSYTLSPNPSNGMYVLKYELNGIKSATINVCDVSGRSLRSVQLNPIESSNTIDLSEFSDGTYFYSLNLDGIQTKSKKVLLIK
jgi:hypothetical protein